MQNALIRHHTEYSLFMDVLRKAVQSYRFYPEYPRFMQKKP